METPELITGADGSVSEMASTSLYSLEEGTSAQKRARKGATHIKNVPPAAKARKLNPKGFWNAMFVRLFVACGAYACAWLTMLSSRSSSLIDLMMSKVWLRKEESVLRQCSILLRNSPR